MKFTDLKGKASKSGPPRMKFQEGINKFRIVSDVVPGYKYWMKTKDGSSVPMDCLGFNRKTEEFDAKQKDWVRTMFPEKKCSWAYTSFVIDRTDGQLKILDHKKKMLAAVIDAANKRMGDPSDAENGWDVIVTRKKTGPKVFDVEYTLEVFDLTNSPLSEEDKELIKDMPDIEEFLKSPTPDEQKAFIENYILDKDEEDEDEVPTEFGQNTEKMDDDIPM